uniref:Uncharacterized protein n=1 Tax=Parascaris equorum TaxID=6256 RepID=A0A914RQY0_PAREQ
MQMHSTASIIQQSIKLNKAHVKNNTIFFDIRHLNGFIVFRELHINFNFTNW